ASATASSYTTVPLIADETFLVRVTNPFGTTESAIATITIGVAPSIAAQPPSQTICPGGIGTIGLSLTGTGPFTYQWYAGMSGDTSSPVGSGSTYTTPPLAPPATYWVRVSNLYGTVDSNTA